MSPVVKTMRYISESTALSLSFVVILLGGVWSFAWSAASTQKAVAASAEAIEKVSAELISTAAQLHAEIQHESSKRVLRHELDSWVSELRLSNPTMSIPAVPKFQ